MKKGLYAAAAASLMIAGTAMASGDETFNLGSALLGGGQVAVYDVELGDNSKGITGFTFSFDYSEPGGNDGSWASDTQVIVTSPTGASYVVGGFDQQIAPDALWSFDGPGSDGNGTYGESFSDIWPNGEPKGTWSVSVENDWNSDANPNQYDNITITFHKIPAPGALALLGVAGLAGRRRRA